jgi:hypothetical protein
VEVNEGYIEVAESGFANLDAFGIMLFIERS